MASVLGRCRAVRQTCCASTLFGRGAALQRARRRGALLSPVAGRGPPCTATLLRSLSSSSSSSSRRWLATSASSVRHWRLESACSELRLTPPASSFSPPATLPATGRRRWSISELGGICKISTDLGGHILNISRSDLGCLCKISDRDY
jgi:hypothetical protein